MEWLVELKEGGEIVIEREWTRRAVLRAAWGGIIAASVLTVNPLVQFLTSDEDQPKSPLVIFKKPVNDQWQNVPNSRVWVKRDSRGVMALVATCTHLGCEVHFFPEKNQWHCPCHGSIYDSEGRPISGPAPRPLPRVEVTLKADGTLLVNTSKQAGMDARAL